MHSQMLLPHLALWNFGELEDANFRPQVRFYLLSIHVDVSVSPLGLQRRALLGISKFQFYLLDDGFLRYTWVSRAQLAHDTSFNLALHCI